MNNVTQLFEAQAEGASKAEDGCPTERAVLQRFWREFEVKIKENQADAKEQGPSDWWKGYGAACRDFLREMENMKGTK